MSSYTGMAAGSLKRTTYNNFRGVDFSGGEVNDSRSPDALNMWKDYKNLGKMIQTRPGLSQLMELDGDVYGLFFYEVNNVKHMIIHAGVKVYDYNMSTGTKTCIKESGMKPARSVGFIFNNILFIKDGLNYYEYNGTTFKEVEGYEPVIAIHKLIDGQTTMVQEANLLTDWVKEDYIPDGVKTDYYLSQKEIDNGLEVWDISGTTPTQITTGFTIDAVNGIVTFDTAPAESYMATIEFRYKKTSDGRTTADKCKLACVFDNRVFMSGNANKPNMLIWSGLNNPRYIGNTSYATLGTDESNVMALVPGNNALWSFKEPSHSNTTIFYSVPYEVYDGKLEQYVKTYATSHSSISTGCKSTGINFNDDIVFLSEQGLEGISSDITTEQVIAHRSSLVDSKMLREEDNPVLIEWEGYLMICYGEHIYLADSRQRVQNNNHIEYEWFYWKFPIPIESAVVIDNILYLGAATGYAKDANGYYFVTNAEVNTRASGGSVVVSYWYDKDNEVLYTYDYTEHFDNVTEEELLEEYHYQEIEPAIYTLGTKEFEESVRSYWTTKEDDLRYPQLLKTTNKKGFISNVEGETIDVYTRLDNKEFELLKTLINTKGFVTTKLKRKKWKTIQFKYQSDNPFGIYDTTFESYIGSYVKRS